MDIVERIRKNFSVDLQSGCFVWHGKTTPNGYGIFSLRGKTTTAHRAMYEVEVGKIPDGLQLDHLCRNRLCINPKHLEPVSARENALRGETGKYKRPDRCRKGHDYSKTGAYIDSKGNRSCSECRRVHSRNWKLKLRNKFGGSGD